MLAPVDPDEIAERYEAASGEPVEPGVADLAARCDTGAS